MTTNITRTDEISLGDLIVLFKYSQGGFRGLSATDFIAFLNSNLTFPVSSTGEYHTQYAVPSSAGFNVTITSPEVDQNVHLILTPTTGLASGTITLPANPADKQEVLVNCTQLITTLTIDPNTASAVTGAPPSLGADDFFRLKYDQLANTWYRVG